LYAIVLAGGYAKRLWPLTRVMPKALLPIAGKPILDYIIEKLQVLSPPLSRIILSTNTTFQLQFEGWFAMRNYTNIDFFPDTSSGEMDKPGAVKAMADIIKKMPEEDVLIVAGDSMFNDDLYGLMQTFIRKKESAVVIYTVNNLEEAKRCATVTLNKAGKIESFIEKPSEPKTTIVSGAVYIFKKGINHQLKEYLKLRLSSDQPGRFVEWLYQHQPVYGYTLTDPLWDIGTPEAYKACDKYFTNLARQKTLNDVNATSRL
jgi:glucose-1-phosphate thymidylyltransferase